MQNVYEVFSPLFVSKAFNIRWKPELSFWRKCFVQFLWIFKVSRFDGDFDHFFQKFRIFLESFILIKIKMEINSAFWF